MVSRPLVSILMPTHSRADVIGFAIESVLAQTVEDFELIVVGDGCAPGTEDVVSRYRDRRIRFLDLPKAPHFGYANRNAALRESRGEIIGFAADDDLLFPDHLELLLKELEGGSALAYSQALWVSTDGIAAPFLTNLTAADELRSFMTRGNSIAASCILYRANSLPVRAPWPEDMPVAADWHLWRRIISENPQSPPSYCRAPTVLHFSATRKNSRHSSSSGLATLLEIADNATWWPAPLRVAIPDEMTEQEVYADLMRADPIGWSAGIRRASNDLVARLAWEDITSVRRALATRVDQIETLQKELSSVRQTAETAKANLRDELSPIRKLLDSAESSLSEANKARDDAMSEGERQKELLGEANATIAERTDEIVRMRATRVWRMHEAMIAGWSILKKRR